MDSKQVQVELSALRSRSGSVKDKRPLVMFLYALMRDWLPAGRVEQLVMTEASETAEAPTVFTNGWLAKYAQDLASRLTMPSAVSGDVVVEDEDVIEDEEQSPDVTDDENTNIRNTMIAEMIRLGVCQDDIDLAADELCQQFVDSLSAMTIEEQIDWLFYMFSADEVEEAVAMAIQRNDDDHFEQGRLSIEPETPEDLWLDQCAEELADLLPSDNHVQYKT